MSISDAFVYVSCDDCGAGEEVELTPLAGRGWDDRNVAKYLLRTGWGVNEDEGTYYCQDCVERRDGRAEQR